MVCFLHKFGVIGFWILWGAVWPLAVWCLGAVWYQRWVNSTGGKILLLVLFVAAVLALQIFACKYRWVLAGSSLLVPAVMLLWLVLLRPTGTRDWDPPFVRLPKAVFSADGKSVTIENIRDFYYRSEDDYDIRYRTETYNFADIVSLDYSITHWDNAEPYGHIILSFGFKDGRHLAFSPEARLEKNERYRILPGIFRHFELIFIFATEEDVFQLRTHHRRYENEEVLLYPTNTQPEVAAFLLRDYLERANKLAEEPEFYNGFTYNCLSSQAPTAEKLGFDFCSGMLRGIFNGLSDRRGFYTGWFRRSDPQESFESYRRRHSVNQYVEHLNNPPNYSELIRPDHFDGCR